MQFKAATALTCTIWRPFLPHVHTVSEWSWTLRVIYFLVLRPSRMLNGDLIMNCEFGWVEAALRSKKFLQGTSSPRWCFEQFCIDIVDNMHSSFILNWAEATDMTWTRSMAFSFIVERHYSCRFIILTNVPKVSAKRRISSIVSHRLLFVFATIITVKNPHPASTQLVERHWSIICALSWRLAFWPNLSFFSRLIIHILSMWSTFCWV